MVNTVWDTYGPVEQELIMSDDQKIFGGVALFGLLIGIATIPYRKNYDSTSRNSFLWVLGNTLGVGPILFIFLVKIAIGNYIQAWREYLSE